MAIQPEHDRFAARETEEAAVRLARRSCRAERRRAERRRARVLTVSGAALGLVLMAGGLTALGSTRGAADVGRSAPGAARRGQASPQSGVVREATIPPAALAEALEPPMQKRADRRPVSEPKKQARDRSASKSRKQAVTKPAKPFNTPAAKPVAEPRPRSVLVRKCSAGCHPTAALLTLRFDSASAAIVTEGMVEAQGVRLTKRERAAVIAALTRK